MWGQISGLGSQRNQKFLACFLTINFTFLLHPTLNCYHVLVLPQRSLLGLLGTGLAVHIWYSWATFHFSSRRAFWNMHSLYLKKEETDLLLNDCKGKYYWLQPWSKANHGQIAGSCTSGTLREWVGCISFLFPLDSLTHSVWSAEAMLKEQLWMRITITTFCLTAKKFSWGNVFGLEMSPKLFYTRTVEFVSRKYFFILTVCNLNQE
jgi:hypothetical protein